MQAIAKILVVLAVATPAAAARAESPLAGKSCEAGSVVTGFTKSGELKCTPLPSAACAADEYMRGFNAATGKATCAKLKDRFYTKKTSPLVSVNLPNSPNLYTAVVTCEAGDIVIGGGGRCAASNFGMTATFPMLENGELGSVGALSAQTGNSWRFNCSLENGPGASSFGIALCMKSK